MKSKIIMFLAACSAFAIFSTLFVAAGLYLMITDKTDGYRAFITIAGVVSVGIWIHSINQGFEALRRLKIKPREECDVIDLYPLFKHLANEHNLILTDSEIFDIIHIVQQMQKEDQQPLFGHTTGRHGKTHWFTFIK